jgi:hypothetical protein
MGTKGTTAQQDQQRLLDEALKQPGVATAIEAYGRLQQYTIQGVVVAPPSYATGGNAA